ncbi:precorrin-6y C5,15-methyltransferase (decarboxylating) subunit CbiE [Sagittula salina]|uniref:Precorrin-6y C5,15-methyltransferase (Decarboxylating) subunit CbiE n=1 Tax=Sagittula salina TaxID=2820268 RepID=A0A940S5E3_9RHOB|nr:precorrin-6y C5,15-methyltransferase (decarboxylating) subunit CbiE [Sagittula salina]MBP0484895.1 precorrin-6y C5,15-methyltransferase (decarboxylating) subunit CbiE [Sagittula salina]
MAESDPWLTILGVGEDGPDGLTPAARMALKVAEVVMGPPRHLDLLSDLLVEGKPEVIEWPVPFADGVARLMDLAGRRVVVLASGDPFWFGAGAVLAERLSPGDWHALPGVSSLSLACARLGWRVDEVTALALHAAPLSRLRPVLAAGRRLFVTLRDGAEVAELGRYLETVGFDGSMLHVMEALGGPRERVRRCRASEAPEDVQHPVAVGIEPVPSVPGDALPLASGRPDAIFETDGVMTKRPVRALTLSALAPRPGEHLWDIGGGSGSIAIEWLMCGPSLSASTVEPLEDRAERIRRNAVALGQDRLHVVQGHAPEALAALPHPDVVFVGGGLSVALVDWLRANLMGVRLVANAVTLESDAVLAEAQARMGGDLMRIDLAQAAPLGPRRGWKAAYPVVQWSVTL